MSSLQRTSTRPSSLLTNPPFRAMHKKNNVNPLQDATGTQIPSIVSFFPPLIPDGSVDLPEVIILISGLGVTKFFSFGNQFSPFIIIYMMTPSRRPQKPHYFLCSLGQLHNKNLSSYSTFFQMVDSLSLDIGGQQILLPQRIGLPL